MSLMIFLEIKSVLSQHYYCCLNDHVCWHPSCFNCQELYGKRDTIDLYLLFDVTGYDLRFAIIESYPG